MVGKSYHSADKDCPQAAQQIMGSTMNIAPSPPDSQEMLKYRRERILEMVIRSVGPGTDVVAVARAAVDFIEKG